MPKYLILWLNGFLKDRWFEVKVGSYTSQLTPIITGVPQGSPLSPILFNVFINDLPMLNDRKNGYTMLYADDLTAFFFFNNLIIKDMTITYRVADYLRKLEWWLCKWRLKMNPNKRNYTVRIRFL